MIAISLLVLVVVGVIASIHSREAASDRAPYPAPEAIGDRF